MTDGASQAGPDHSTRALVPYLATVVALGAAAIAHGLIDGAARPLPDNLTLIATVVALLLMADIRPVRIVKGREAGTVTIVFAYVAALTVLIPGYGAVPIVAATSLIGDTTRRIAAHKALFNAASIAMAAWAAASILQAFGSQTALIDLDINGWDIIAFCLAGSAVYTITNVLILIVIGLVTAEPPIVVLRRDFFVGFSDDTMLLAQAPMLVVAGLISLWLLPFALVLTFGLYRSGRTLAAAEEQAASDVLTGLANRRRFDEAAEVALGRADRAGVRPTVVLVDLDGFKAINDTHGHATGDEVLRTVAMALREITGEEDTVARFGGDEFAVLLPDTTDRAADDVERIRKVFPLVVNVEDEATVTVQASIGFSQALTGTDGVGALLRAADAAMYAAKRGTTTEAVESPAKLRELAEALDNGQVALAFQPLLHLRTQAVMAFEALLRWDHPERGTISADQFVPIAETSSLIRPLTRWVLTEACAAGARLAESRPVDIHVNVSSRNLVDLRFPGDVTDASSAAGFPLDRLVIEISDIATSDAEISAATIHQLADMGVRVALDGVGSDATHTRMRELPVASIKIHRSVIAAVSTPGGKAQLAALSRFGAARGVAVVVEGVETRDELAEAVASGADYAQGLRLGRPMPLDQAAAWLDGRSSLDADVPTVTMDTSNGEEATA